MKVFALLASLLLAAPLSMATPSENENPLVDAQTMGAQLEANGMSTLRRHHGQVACYARDGRGRYYQAIGRVPWRVQQRALNKCYRFARYCQALGCEYF